MPAVDAITGLACLASYMAGGGVKRGSVYGASDALAAEPADSPLSSKTMLARFFTSSESMQQVSHVARRPPQQIVMNGKVAQGLLAGSRSVL